MNTNIPASNVEAVLSHCNDLFSKNGEVIAYSDLPTFEWRNHQDRPGVITPVPTGNKRGLALKAGDVKITESVNAAGLYRRVTCNDGTCHRVLEVKGGKLFFGETFINR